MPDGTDSHDENAISPNRVLAMDDSQVVDLLRQFDEAEVADRVDRLRQVNRILAEYGEQGFLHTAGIEATWILEEARQTYVYGFFIASIFASHSACERRLAEALDMISGGDPPKGSGRWGLGSLIVWARGVGLSQDLAERLEQLAEDRRQLAHYKHIQGDDPAWVTRVLRPEPRLFHEDDWVAEAVARLGSDALKALSTAYAVYFRLSGLP